MLGHTNIKTTAIYLSTIQKDLLNAAKKAAGLDVNDSEEETRRLQLKKCQRCGRSEDPLSVRCGNCGTFLDVAVAMKFGKMKDKSKQKTDKEIRNEIDELREIILQQQKMMQEFMLRQQKS